MCGIWAYFANRSLQPVDYTKHKNALHSMRERGPDRHIEVIGQTYHLCFHRLAIHDLSLHGDQPFAFHDDNDTYMTYMCNGEIYNWKELYAKYGFQPKSKSDCEIIGHLMQYFDYDFSKVLQEIQGEFAIVCRVETAKGDVTIFAARDPFGVRPLYYGQTEDGGYVFSSNLKGIVDMGTKGDHVPPRNMIAIQNGSQTITPYYELRDKYKHTIANDMYERITGALIQAVQTRLDSERPIGFLLSGGLDSSLVVAIATRILGLKNVSTFSIGMKGSVDLKYARQVAEHLGTKHTEVVFTEEEGLSVIPEVIRTLETYDITTIRASVGQYLLARHIRDNTKIRVILNGDGADETECGYLYFYYAPSPRDAHNECIRLLENIHRYDGLRVDRTIANHGLEARLPFLDPTFVETYLSTPCELRIPTQTRMEKQLIRDAFATLYPDILPREVLYRIKNAFSDGVSTREKSWFETIQEYVATNFSMKEADYYKTIFDRDFPDHDHVIPGYWMPQWTDAKDPSARVLSVFNETQ